MNCPKCDAEMEQVTFHDVEVDRCVDCKGLWFDSGERERLATLVDSAKIDPGDAEVGKRFDAKTHLDCPRCGARLIPMVDPLQSHIWYESCLVCGGVFFDAGEFRDYRERTVADFFRDLLKGQRG